MHIYLCVIEEEKEKRHLEIEEEENEIKKSIYLLIIIYLL